MHLGRLKNIFAKHKQANIITAPQNSTPADLLRAFENFITTQKSLDYNGIYKCDLHNTKSIEISANPSDFLYIVQGKDGHKGSFYGLHFKQDEDIFNFYQKENPTEYATLERLYNVCTENLKKANERRQQEKQQQEQHKLNASVLYILKTAAELSGNKKLGPTKNYTKEDLIDACVELAKTDATSLRFQHYVNRKDTGWFGVDVLANYRKFSIIRMWNVNNPNDDTYTIEVCKTSGISEYKFSKSNEDANIFQKLETLLNICEQNIEPSKKRIQEQQEKEAAKKYQQQLNARTNWFTKQTMKNM